jgi:hypothetical protein
VHLQLRDAVVDGMSMRKRLIGLATVISTVMAVGALAWSFHSRSSLDVVKFFEIGMAAKNGQVGIQYPCLSFYGERFVWRTTPYDMKNDPMPPEFRPPMFGFYRTMELKNGWQRVLVFPLWAAAIAFCILPALWVKRRVWPKQQSDQQEKLSEGQMRLSGN